MLSFCNSVVMLHDPNAIRVGCPRAIRSADVGEGALPDDDALGADVDVDVVCGEKGGDSEEDDDMINM